MIAPISDRFEVRKKEGRWQVYDTVERIPVETRDTRDAAQQRVDDLNFAEAVEQGRLIVDPGV